MFNLKVSPMKEVSNNMLYIQSVQTVPSLRWELDLYHENQKLQRHTGIPMQLLQLMSVSIHYNNMNRAKTSIICDKMGWASGPLNFAL